MKKLNEVYLINEELLKQFFYMSRNVGVDKIIPYINLSQPFYIVPVLGEPLVEELQEEIESNTLTELNKALILKIAPALALWTDYMASRSLAYTITQKGFTKEKSDNSESLDKEELAYFRLQIKNDAEMATDLLIKYLCKCKDNYPKWQPQNECQCAKYEKTYGEATKPFKPVIYFPSQRNKGCGKCDK